MNPVKDTLVETGEVLSTQARLVAESCERLAATLGTVDLAGLNELQRSAVAAAAAPLVTLIDDAAAHLDRGRQALVTSSNLLWAMCPPRQPDSQP